MNTNKNDNNNPRERQFIEKQNSSIRKVVLINLIVFLGMLFIVFISFELYLRYEKAFSRDSENAVGISIFQESEINTYEHEANAIDYNGYGYPLPKVQINNLGLRDSDFFYNEKDNNILMIGDSLTFGTGLSIEKVFTELLEKKLNDSFNQKWNIINAGHIGYTADNYYLVLKKYFNIIKPKIIVINLFVGNDITEFRKHKWVEEKGEIIKIIDSEHYVNEEKQLMRYTQKTPKSFALYHFKQRLDILGYKLNINSNNGPTLTWPVFLDDNNKEADPKIDMYWSQLEEMLIKINEFTKNNNTKLLISIIPMDTQVSKHYWDKYTIIHFDDEAFEKKRPQKRLYSFCEDNELSCLNLLEYFEKSLNKDHLYFQNEDPHFDIDGHILTADILYEKTISLFPDLFSN